MKNKAFLFIIFLLTSCFVSQDDEVETIKTILEYGLPGPRVSEDILNGFDLCKKAQSRNELYACLDKSFSSFDDHFGMMSLTPKLIAPTFLRNRGEYIYFRVGMPRPLVDKELNFLKSDKDIFLDMRKNRGGQIKYANILLCEILKLDKCEDKKILYFVLLFKFAMNKFLFDLDEPVISTFLKPTDVYKENLFVVTPIYEKVSDFSSKRKSITVVIDQDCFSACATMASIIRAFGHDICTNDKEFHLRLSSYWDPVSFVLPRSGLKYYIPSVYVEYKKKDYQEFLVKKCNKITLTRLNKNINK